MVLFKSSKKLILHVLSFLLLVIPLVAQPSAFSKVTEINLSTLSFIKETKSLTYDSPIVFRANSYHDYVFFTYSAKREKMLRDIIKLGIINDIAPHLRFFTNSNNKIIGYRFDKAFDLYPKLTLQEHLVKALKDEEYTDSKAVENLFSRLNRKFRNTKYCVVNLTDDAVGMFFNRCYLLNLDCIVSREEVVKHSNKHLWKIHKELDSSLVLKEREHE